MSLWNISDGLFNWQDLYEPLIDIVGVSLTFGLLFMMIGAIIWKYDESGYGVTGYMILIGILGTAIFPPQIKLFFGIIAAIGIGSIFYRLYKTRGQL